MFNKNLILNNLISSLNWELVRCGYRDQWLIFCSADKINLYSISHMVILPYTDTKMKRLSIDPQY